MRCARSTRFRRSWTAPALAYALAADECAITLPEPAQLCDVFYIGGTKCGALCGETVVFCGMHAPAHPIPRIKQHGALLAKGRLTGVPV